MNTPAVRCDSSSSGDSVFKINSEIKIGEQGKVFAEQGSPNRDQGAVLEEKFGSRGRSVVLAIILGC